MTDNAASPGAQTPSLASQATDPPPPAVVPKAADVVGTPEWLNPRLDQAKRSERERVLKDLGIEDLAVAKKAIDDAKTRADADKTASELAASERTKREKAEKELEAYRTAFATRADREFATLTPAQQAFVERIAGTDPAKRLATIEDVRALIVATQPAVPAAVEQKPEPKPGEAAAPTVPSTDRKPLPAPASTAAGGASPSGRNAPPVDHLAVLDRLDRSNPIAAGNYYATHRRAIDVARAQKTAAATSQ